MRGHIRQRNKGTWEIAIEVGKDPVTGKRKQYFETLKGSRKDAEKRRVELLSSVDKGSYIKPSNMTVAVWLEKWLQDYAVSRCSARTVEIYKVIIRRHLIPAFGQLLLKDLQPHHIQEYCAAALINGRTDGKGGLSRRTVLHHHRLLHKTLSDALRQGYIARNVCEAVDPPRPARKEMNALSPEEVPYFLDEAKETPFYVLFYTLLFTGLRRSEALGLKWGKVDLYLSVIYVTQTLNRLSGGKYVQGDPKTLKSKRQVDLPPSLAVLLREYKENAIAQKKLLGQELLDDDYVFAYPDNRHFDPSTITHYFKKVVRKMGLPYLRLHDLRHSHVSLMVAAGVNIKVISERLGHSDIGITLNTYAHLFPGMGKAAAHSLDTFLKPMMSEIGGSVGNPLASHDQNLARPEGFEPTTLGSEDRCSIH